MQICSNFYESNNSHRVPLCNPCLPVVAIAHAPGAAAVWSSGGVVRTWSLPPVSPREHKMLGWQHDGRREQWVHLAIYNEVMETQAVGYVQAVGSDDVAEMERAMYV